MKLKAKRAEHGYTQAKVAELLNISTSSYIHKENGDTQFSLDEVKRLLKIFNCQFEDIFLL